MEAILITDNYSTFKYWGNTACCRNNTVSLANNGTIRGLYSQKKFKMDKSFQQA